MQSVTLGGDRLGAGNKMKVDLKTYNRSTHNLSEIFRTTQSPGTIVPCYKKLCLPGDKWEIELDINQLTHPTIGPLFGSYKSQTDAFIVPIRLYQAKLHMNMINIGRNMSAIKLPMITMKAELVPNDTENIDIAQVNPSSLMAYMGVRGIGMRNEQPTGDVEREFNAIPILGYWDIVKQYYANKQEEIGAVIHATITALNEDVTAITIDGDALTQGGGTPVPLIQDSTIVVTYVGTAPAYQDIIITFQDMAELALQFIAATWVDDGAGTITINYDWPQYGDSIATGWRYRTATDIREIAPEVVTFPLSNIDEMRQRILLEAMSSAAYRINDANLAPYKYLYEKQGDFPNIMNSQEGLAVKTYQSDLLNNWVNTEWIDGAGGIAEVTAVDTSSGEFTMDQLNLSKKVYEMLNRIAVSGGTYKDWIDVTYTESGAWRADNPVYLGSLIKELVFQEVVSNSQTAEQPLGTIAGKGVLSSKHKGGYINFSVDEPSYLIIVTSLTPRVDYSQGNDWDMNLLTMDDFHKPQLDEIGFQELITEQMAWWDITLNAATNTWEAKSAGKQPAWVNYMTSINKTYGNFAVQNNEMFMTLNRRYEWETDGDDVTIKDLTTYIDPVKYNTIFANTSIDAMNFWTQIRIDAKVRRVMSGKLMPTV